MKPIIIAITIVLWIGTVPSIANENDEFKEFVEQQNQQFQSYMDEQERDYEKYKADIVAKWNEFKGSTKKEWMDYSSDKETRSHVDFEEGAVYIEVLVPVKEKEPKKIAENKIKKQLERIVSNNWPTQKNPLADQIIVKKDEPLSKKNIEQFVEKKVQPEIRVEKETIKPKDQIERRKVTVKFDMVPNHIKIRAKEYEPFVVKYCQEYKLDPAIIFGIIHTESFFNPMARSHIPAFGLMQLVPKSGGRDAYRHVFGKDKVPSSNFLYNPENNIRLGIGYIDLTKNVYFSGVKNDVVGYLITVASYNTGPGNVSKAFTGKTRLKPAIQKISTMNPEQVHKILINKLPYKETQDYVQRVFTRSKLYR